MNQPTVDITATPAELEGRTIVSVNTETYQYDDAYADIYITTEDGTTFRISSCDCCGGMTFKDVA